MNYTKYIDSLIEKNFKPEAITIPQSEIDRDNIDLMEDGTVNLRTVKVYYERAVQHIDNPYNRVGRMGTSSRIRVSQSVWNFSRLCRYLGYLIQETEYLREGKKNCTCGAHESP